MKTATRAQQVTPIHEMRATPSLRVTPTDTDSLVVEAPSGKYVQLSAPAGLVLSTMQAGTMSDLRAVQAELGSERFERITQSLLASGILCSKNDGAGPQSGDQCGARVRRLQLERVTLIRFELLSGRRALTALRRPWAFITHPAALVVILFVSLYGLVIAGNELVRHGFSAGEQSTPVGAALAVALLVVATTAHELGHGLELERRGAQAGGFGVMLLWFMPAAYCDVSNVWTIPDRAGRVAVSAAGPIVSLFAGGVAAAVFEFGYDAPWLRLFLVANLAILVFNLSPFFRTDTYWMISHWLRRPRLLGESRHQALRMLRSRSRRGQGFSWLDALYGVAGVVVMPLVVAAYWLA